MSHHSSDKSIFRVQDSISPTWEYIIVFPHPQGIPGPSLFYPSIYSEAGINICLKDFLFEILVSKSMLKNIFQN